MALTEKQVYNLGIGDEIIVHGKCEDVYGDGDIRVSTYWTVAGEKREQSFLVQSSCVSLPPEKPKYDPCRLFRKGDKVRAVKCNGRFFHDAGKYLFGAYCEVADDEENGKLIRVFHNSSEYRWDPAYLELVTPVEELEPYELVETTDYWSVEKENKELCLFWKEHHPNAKEAAEAECDRLNAEYKKNMPV